MFRTPFLRDERGVASIVIATAIAAFSVLALTMLTDPSLRMRLSNDRPDIHVVLYTADTGLRSLSARLNISSDAPQPLRQGVALEIPISEEAQAGDIQFGQAGWKQVVQLGARLTVCCDSGDGACHDLNPSDPVASGTSNAELKDIRATGAGGEQEVRFDLEPVALDDVIARQLPPNEGRTASLLKATRISEAMSDKPEHTATAAQVPIAMSCRLNLDGKSLATGTLSLKQAAVPSPEPGTIPSPTLTGSIQLKVAK